MLPYTGLRCSVVFFATRNWRASHDLGDLAYLGFATNLEPSRCFPFVVAVPSHSRARALASKTLRVLREGGIPAAQIHVFVDPGERSQYESVLGSAGVAVEDGAAGLPMQRRAVAKRFPKERVLCVDDDLEAISWAQEANPDLRVLFWSGFKLAEVSGAKLWSVNVSCQERRTRAGVLHGLGLLNGFLYGLCRGSATTPTPISDRRGGVGEDIERSLRAFVRDGRLLRLQSACARTRCGFNAGGLQARFSEASRRLALDEVVAALSAEFPGLIRAAPGPLRCTLTRARPQEPLSVGGDDGRPHACNLCDKRFRRKKDRDVHEQSAHRGEKPFPCSYCGYRFARHQDRVKHERTRQGCVPGEPGSP